MTSAQLKRREALLARNDAALERWPDRTGTDFSREMKAVVEGLKTLAGKVDTAGGDPLECSRNWRYVGNAYFDLANAKDLPLLILAVAAYEKSEAFLAGTDDAVERMKLDYSLGNALFHLSDAKNLDLLQRARRRYASALAIASAEMPAAVDPARRALAAADRVIALLTQAQGLSGRIEKLKDELERTEEEQPMDPLQKLERNTDRLRPILGHLADVERRLQAEIAVPLDELEQVAREIDELREVSEEMGSGPWSVFYQKYSTLLHEHLQAAGIRPAAPCQDSTVQ